METAYEPTIGLEVHAELATTTKLFCSSRNDPDEREANRNICPVCLAHPGTLPVLNGAAVRHVLRVGAAIGGTLATFSEFDRKNYFYPDLPKGYQISQYAHPLVLGGMLAGVLVTRVHLEEDTARSQHSESGDASALDFNRAGVPLMELVTEPVIHSPDVAARFARELQLLLRSLGASGANMEKGEMRLEANISVRRKLKVESGEWGENDAPLGTKVEVKNLNSVRALRRAIDYEIERQAVVLERGEKVRQETRGWDEAGSKTFSQRLKEDSHDYRYFPDPDVPKLRLDELPEFSPESIRASLPELPEACRARYRALGLSEEDAAYYVGDRKAGEFFDALGTLAGGDSALLVRASNYIVSDVAGIREEVGDSVFDRLTPESFLELMRMAGRNELSSRGAKEVLKIMTREGGEPRRIGESAGLMQESGTDALAALARSLLAEHPDTARDVKSGKAAALQFLVGQGMKKSRGAANPELLRAALEQAIAVK
ncbi:MAG: Asp-tRNA(Asn)/Glu-tRNA(Gln) amidotransferase subunit GatB [bacterium]|nr:Asp-tRNA(Asn)/Glu-tRNA(Gln) amidotransferase subunit GatB [bacterium]MDZ4284789.1 Asp-tRNA(Asn)/Glu-tRNA(Gln) amidotransferase subunit GatB [Patescibacteria group bacterium]